MAFEDSATLGAVDRYQQTRASAPAAEQCRFHPAHQRPEPTRTGTRHSVRRQLSDPRAGDVYLGAPCAVPLDPRHRLLSSKYNPARTHTAEGTVGIGGMYMCIYGMDSPGGYQLVGRTLPIWNKFLKTRSSPPVSHGCCASSIRCASTRSVSKSWTNSAKRSVKGACRCASKRANSTSLPTPISGRQRGGDRRLPASPAAGVQRRSGALAQR